MRKSLIMLLFAVLMLAMPAYGKKKNDKLMAEWATYEATTNTVGQNGTKFLKVWGYGKNVDKAIEQAKKNAVHACLFRGVPGSATAKNTPAIFAQQGGAQVAEDNFDYFYDFFEDAQTYIAFVNVTTDGVPSGQDRREVKGGYKVALDVQVMYDNLRAKMEEDGLLKKNSSMFTN